MIYAYIYFSEIPCTIFFIPFNTHNTKAKNEYNNHLEEKFTWNNVFSNSGVVVIILGNGHSGSSSNPTWGYWKRYASNYSTSSYRWIVGQTGLFNLSIATSPEVEKLWNQICLTLLKKIDLVSYLTYMEGLVNTYKNVFICLEHFNPNAFVDSINGWLFLVHFRGCVPGRQYQQTWACVSEHFLQT